MTSPEGPAALFDRPIILVSTPRAGSTLLFETLAKAPGLYSPGGESHGRIERVKGLFPPERGWDSNRLTADDASDLVIRELSAGFYADARDRDGRIPAGTIRFLEKTPKNALRIPFFDKVWRDAHFVYLYREPRETMASMIEAWVSGRFRTYPGLPGWTGHPWSLLLVPGWRELIGLPLPAVVAHQWAITTSTMIADLEALPKERVHVIDHAALLASPQQRVEELARSLDLKWDRALGTELPLSKTTVSRPSKDKWKAIEQVIEELIPIISKSDEQARAFLQDRLS